MLRRRHDLETFERGLLERLAVIGVRDADEFVCALADALSEEVRDAVLRHDVVNMSASGRHASTCNQIMQSTTRDLDSTFRARRGPIMLSPFLMKGTILLSPFFVMAGIAMMGLPKPSSERAAPRMKSI